MRYCSSRFLRMLLCVSALSATNAAANTFAVGYISWDLIFPGNAGQFDITNLTGPNEVALGDPIDFPVSTLLSLSNLALHVDFNNATAQSYTSSYFTLDTDGESEFGKAIPIGGTNPKPIDATVTGMFSSTSINVVGVGLVTISPTFSASFSDTPTLADGDLGVIYATTASTTTPEPRTWILLAISLTCLAAARKSKWRSSLLTITVGTFAVHSSFGAVPTVNLSSGTSPGSGVAGVTDVNVTGSLFPSGTITPSNVVVTLAATCGGTAVSTATVNSIKTVVGSVKRLDFNLPSGLVTGTYYVTVADSAPGDSDFTTTSGSCSAVQVTTTNPILNACVAGSSLGVLLPSGNAKGNVTAYVPKGYWESGATGVYVQNIEGTIGTTSTIPTPHAANSCSSNPATSQTICVGNNTDVYLITGTTLNTTLTSGSNTSASFSGGTCSNCGVAINASNNTAAINMGLSGGASNDGIQILNLSTNTFTASLPMNYTVSENISVDPTRGLILSADESGHYVLVQIQADGSLREFDPSFSSGGEDDSSAEDCSTGIALAPIEFSGASVQMVNLNAITYNSPSAGQYTAPNAVVSLTTAYGFAAGPSGSAVAQGSGHLGVITGEFGGNTFAVLKLPATPSSNTPALSDYVVGSIPSNPACGGTFSAGFDPHTVTAYTSPNTGDSYAVFAGYSGSVPVCLAVVDMSTLINTATRGGSGYQAHDISPVNFPAGAVTYFPL